MNLSETKSKIKAAGPMKVRTVPMPGEAYDGQHQVEINGASGWEVVLSGVSRQTATQIIREAVGNNKLILG